MVLPKLGEFLGPAEQAVEDLGGIAKDGLGFDPLNGRLLIINSDNFAVPLSAKHYAKKGKDVIAGARTAAEKSKYPIAFLKAWNTFRRTGAAFMKRLAAADAAQVSYS